MESGSPAGFERELQDFTVMAWEYYGNEKMQGKAVCYICTLVERKVQDSIYY